MLTDYFVSMRIVRLGDQLQNKIAQKVSYILHTIKPQVQVQVSYIHYNLSPPKLGLKATYQAAPVTIFCKLFDKGQTKKSSVVVLLLRCPAGFKHRKNSVS